jgi:hypothetical protein
MARHDPRGTQAAIHNVMKWARRPEWSGLYDDVLDQHIGEVLKERGLASVDDLIAELGAAAFVAGVYGPAFEDFLTRDNDNGESIVDDYVRRRGFKESVPGRRYLQALRDSVMSIYEVIESVPNSHLVLRDRLRGGAPVRVEEHAGSRQLVKWDTIATRVVPLNRQHVLSGVMLPVEPEMVDDLERLFGEMARALGKDLDRRLVQAMRESADKSASGGADDVDEAGDDDFVDIARSVLKKVSHEPFAELAKEFNLPADEAAAQRLIEERWAALTMQISLHASAPIFTRLWLTRTLAQRDAPLPEIRNYDGEPIVYTETRWPLIGGAAEAARRLDDAESQRIYRRDPDDLVWVWEGDKSLSGGPQAAPADAAAPDLIAVGNIEIKDDALVLNTNSEGRAARGRALIEPLLAGLLGSAAVTRREPLEEAMARNGDVRSAAAAIPAAEKARVLNEFKDRHYRAWLDMSISVFDGRTPRQAAQTEDGRAKIVRELKDLENREQRMARAGGLPPYDASWIWRELGVSADLG